MSHSKPLCWFSRPSSCWVKLMAEALSLQQCSRNHEIAKGTGEVYRVKSFVHNSNRVMVLSPQGLLRRRRISAFRKGKNWGSIPFSACNTFFLCRLNGVEGDGAKKRSFLNILPRKVQVTHQKKRTFLSLSKSWLSGTAVGNSDHMMMRTLKIKKKGKTNYFRPHLHFWKIRF